MEYLNRYRRKIGQMGFDRKAKNPWIENSLNKIQIQLVDDSVEGEEEEEGVLLDAVLIFKDKNGPDNGILYTYRDDGLEVGDVIIKQDPTAATVRYLLYEEVSRVDYSKDTRVFKTLEVNSRLHIKDKSWLAWVKHSIMTIAEEDRRWKERTLSVDSTAIAILPKDQDFKIEAVFDTVENIVDGTESFSSWRIINKDDISSPYIVYLTLVQKLKSDLEPYNPPSSGEVITVETGKNVEPLGYYIAAGADLSLDTEAGFIKTDPSCKILKRTANKVTIEIPTTPGDLTVTVLEDDEEKEIYYVIF